MVSLITESGYQTNLTKMYILPLTCTKRNIYILIKQFCGMDKYTNYTGWATAQQHSVFTESVPVTLDIPQNTMSVFMGTISLVESSSSVMWWIIQSKQVTIEKTRYCWICTHCSVRNGDISLSVHHPGPDWNVSTTIRWIGGKFGTDINQSKTLTLIDWFSFGTAMRQTFVDLSEYLKSLSWS